MFNLLIRMKTLQSFIFLFILMTTYSCNNTKPILEEDPPFLISEATFQKWFGGTQNAGGGIQLTLIFSKISEGVDVEKVYFRGKSENLKQDHQNSKSFVATFVDKPKQDIILDRNSIKEMDNPKPSITVKSPFDLEANQAVIQYQVQSKTFYYKMNNVTEKEAVSYPSSKPDDN